MRNDKRSHRLLVMCALILSPCASAWADVVSARGRAPLVDTQVLRLAEGKLVCRSENGGEVAVPVEQVEYMQVLGWQMFNLAEKQRRWGDWHRAAVSYEKELADLQLDATGAKPKPDELDRVLLVQCRLIPACDALGRFERALELYLEVVERMPAVVDVLRPKKLPETGLAWLEQADKLIDVVIARHDQNHLGRRLSEWKQSWPRPAASAPAWSPETLPGSPFDPRMREAIQGVATMVAGGRHVDAVWRISALQNEAQGGARAELYYWKGRALQAMAADEPATSARAGLAYMRVVMHFPGHQLAGECLYRAGDLCRQSGRNEQAEHLWMELVANYPKSQGPDGTVWADRAREELKR